jgi:glycosyltransferase involved in cell wall biosynthesis
VPLTKIDKLPEPTFTVIVPTAGRPTLTHTLASIVPQLEPGDQLIVDRNDDRDFGNAARNRAIDKATTSHLVFLDDDDEWLPGALDAMRAFARDNPGRIGLFGSRYELHGDHFNTTLEPGAFSSSMGVFPNDRRLGRFAPARELRPLRPGETPEGLAIRWGDTEFFRSTLELHEDPPILVPVVTSVVRPEKRRWTRFRFRLRLRSRLQLK